MAKRNSGIRWPRKYESREGRSIGWNNRSSCRYVSSSSAKVSLTPSLRFLRCKNAHARYRWHETTTMHGHLLCQGPCSHCTPCGSVRAYFLLLSSPLVFVVEKSWRSVCAREESSSSSFVLDVNYAAGNREK